MLEYLMHWKREWFELLEHELSYHSDITWTVKQQHTALWETFTRPWRSLLSICLSPSCPNASLSRVGLIRKTSRHTHTRRNLPLKQHPYNQMWSSIAANTDGLGGRVVPNICCVEILTFKMNWLLQDGPQEHRCCQGLNFHSWVLCSSGAQVGKCRFKSTERWMHMNLLRCRSIVVL